MAQLCAAHGQVVMASAAPAPDAVEQKWVLEPYADMLAGHSQNSV
jgi:hypothetical protein